jgi:nucleotide-binding universal stress UspA family protein
MTYIPETADMADTVPLRILVPLDGTPRSQQALPYAQSLAMSPATIILLEVLPDPEPERGLRGNITLPAEAVGQRQAAAATDALEKVAARIRQETPAAGVEVAVIAGGSADQILRVARARRTDLIVIATYSRSPVSRLVLGSVTDQVVRAADTPVLVVRPQDAAAPARVSRLVVPLDGSPTATAALRLAVRLARQAALPVHLVTVADPRHDDAKYRMKRHYKTLAEFGLSVSAATLVGEPARAIEETTRPDDLIVMASHHRAGVKAWLLHGVAERLISHGRCPVLITPPMANVTVSTQPN